MSGPVHMNQVIIQTPNVEKIHQAEHQQPDQIQRHAHHESQVQFREKTETVQHAPDADRGRAADNESRRRRADRLSRSARHETAEISPDNDGVVDFSDRIVDIVV